MIIYLDESKKLGEWKIVFWGFITKHKNSYIEKFVFHKKAEYWVYDWVELKSIKPIWKYFYEKMSSDTDFWIINNNIIWINVSWYYKDSFAWYKDIIVAMIDSIYASVKNYNKDIVIIADRVNFWKNIRKIELEIEQKLQKSFPFYGKYKFIFWNSKSYSWVQLADLFAYKLREYNISWKELDEFLSENNFNIDFEKVLKIEQ